MGVTSFVTAITPRYADALQSTITRVATLAQVWSGDAVLATFNPEPGLSVLVDRNNVLRRTVAGSVSGGVTADGHTVVPVDATSLFAPVGNELHLWRGIQYLDGSGDVELVPEGVFGLEDIDVKETGADLVVSFTGNDRGQPISRSQFTDPWVVAPNYNVGQAIMDIITSRSLGFSPVFNFAAIPYVTGPTSLVFPDGDDPLADLLQMAAACGCEFFPDPSGTYVLQPIPDPTQAAISWTFNADPPASNANILSGLTRHLSRKLACNYIIRIGEGSGIDVPVRAVAADTNPLSPTRISGPYGQQVDRATSPLLLTTGQCQNAADARLLLSLGSLETLDMSIICKPDANVDDVMQATRTRAGILGEQYVLDAFSVPFTAGEKMQINKARAISSFPGFTG
jgi:hypothetical protein